MFALLQKLFYLCVLLLALGLAQFGAEEDCEPIFEKNPYDFKLRMAKLGKELFLALSL